MPKKPVKKTIKFAQKVAPKLKKPKVPTAPKTVQKTVKKPMLKPVIPPSMEHLMHLVQSAQSVTPQQSEAERIWEEIKNLPIQMFGLPGQVIAQHAAPFSIEPSKLYLTIRSSATLPSLESALNEGFEKRMCGSFTVEQADRFVVVARKTASMFPPPAR